MYTIENFKITKVFLREEGIFVHTKYADWQSDYEFLITSDGAVQGRNFAGIWQELSRQTASIIREKCHEILCNKGVPIS